MREQKVRNKILKLETHSRKKEMEEVVLNERRRSVMQKKIETKLLTQRQS